MVFISSCSKNSNSDGLGKFSIEDLPQTWELTSINAGLSGKNINAEDIPVLETYVFKNNGILSKQFQDEFTEGNLNGTYEVVLDGENEYLILTYETGIDSLSYCSRNNMENMLISNDGRALSNFICSSFDGPSMSYRRIE